MANPGSVSFNFKRMGEVVVHGEGLSEEKVLECAMEAGAEDVKMDAILGFRV